jgi:hypothetical protein
MRIEGDGRASSLPPRNWWVYGAARHSQPKTPFDEQPASSASGGLGDAASAASASATAACLAALPEFSGTISNQRFNKCGVHGSSFDNESCHKSSCRKNSCQADLPNALDETGQESRSTLIRLHLAWPSWISRFIVSPRAPSKGSETYEGDDMQTAGWPM